ncbi:hypothetical protein L2E82_29240 [Cichorium intybus]|uniref:Uncharacterized protein n=1 Tax=Cichorium intybus TaxID=13427 RepID=A0ACB9CXM9_CICIN|nr:hypothetical protein L2E82_29240 [Cichorium intybus]
MLLTIDPEFRKDFESLGPYELMQSVEEKFQKPVKEERARIFKRLAECKLKEGSSINSHVLQIEAYIGELYKLGYSMSQELSVNTLLASLTSKYDLFIQTYRKEDQKKTLIEMRPLLTLYESLLDRHSSNGSATSGLSPVKRHSKKRSRSFGHVLNWESTKSDTVAERLEDAPRSKSFESSVLYKAHVARNESPKDPEDRILESCSSEPHDQPEPNQKCRFTGYPAVPGKERALLERTHVLRKQWELEQS